MDKLRRCDARDKDGHRCRKHIHHLREVKDSATGTALPAETEGSKHRAFGRDF